VEPLLQVEVLKEVFQRVNSLGDMQEYIDRVNQLHHSYLEARLLASDSEISLNLWELAKFAKDAEYLAMEYTNPLVIERIDTLPYESVPSRKVVQDARAVAGTILEFLGDAISAQETRLLGNIPLDRVTTENIEGISIPEEMQDLYELVGRPGLLYIKAALCYGLGIYEPRTKVILRELLKRLSKPKLPLSLANTAQWADYLICNLLSRNIFLVIQHMFDLKHQIDILRQWLKMSVETDLHEQMSLRRITEINISLLLIESCIFHADAFLRGNTQLFEQAQTKLSGALVSIQHIQDASLEWVIRTLGKVTVKMWADSSWIRLGPLIPKRTYLSKLVEDGIITLWSSQIAALEMTSKSGPLVGGYLDDRIKRVVIHMPTSAGKTFLAQLAIAYQSFSNKGGKCIYVGFSRALCDQVASDLAKRLSDFGIRVTALASDNELLTDTYESILFKQSTVITVTPEKLNYLLRQQNNTLLQETKLFIFDELHNISKQNRGWVYEELISLLLQHPTTKNTKMLFLSAVMPNHLAIQEWVDPERTCETISHSWQPTRTLKGVVQIPFGTIPHISKESPQEVSLPGHLVYARRKEDVNSPLRIDNFISSKQIIKHITKAKPGKPARKYWQRDRVKSENDIRNAAKVAVRFARLGPVLVYCPLKKDTAKLCDHIIHLLRNISYIHFKSESDKVQYEETLAFLQERLSPKHPLLDAIKHGIAFHHADLPRDVRNEIEYAYQSGWIQIICSTTTLAEGVNFPIKTLLLSHYGTPSENGIQNPLSKSDFKNIVGRAGRALYETEGQVIFMESVVGYPYYPETGYRDYLDLDATSSELSIRSALGDEKILEQLRYMVDAVDSGNLTDEELLFNSSQGKGNGEIERMVKRLQTFTLLLQEQKLVGEDEESFIRIFQTTFLGKQKPDEVQRTVGPFSHRSARAIRSQIDSVERSLFAQTGLKIPTCRELLRRVNTYWEQKSKQLRDFVDAPLDRQILYDIAQIIYTLGDSEVDPEEIKVPSKKSFNHMDFFVDWISPIKRNDRLWSDDELHSLLQEGISPLETDYFSFVADLTERAQDYTSYVYHTLEYKAPWTLSAFWLFSKHSVKNFYDLDLINTPLGKELALLPAYAKFGVNSPAAALFSTLGISPSSLARQLAELYARQNPGGRYNYATILQWILELQSCDLEGHAFKSSHIRRVRRILKSVRPIEGENTLQEAEQAWRMTFWIAGWYHYKGDTVLHLIHTGTQLLLEREPGNRYNPDAVKVFFDNVLLGYVPDELCEAVARRIDRGHISAQVIRVSPSKKVYVYCETKI
jgi:helicase